MDLKGVDLIFHTELEYSYFEILTKLSRDRVFKFSQSWFN